MSTLKEKFYKEIRFMERAEICEKIADDYAIEFKDFCDKYICENCNGDGYTIEVEAECCRRSNYECCGCPDPVQVQKQCYCSVINTQELLEIFKKQNGY